MQEPEWIKVYATAHVHQAMIIQSVLEENQIESVLLNQKDSLYVVIGEVAVMVKAEDVEKAAAVIEREIQ